MPPMGRTNEGKEDFAFGSCFELNCNKSVISSQTLK